MRDIDIGDFIFLGVGRHFEIGKGEAVVVVQSLRVAAADGIAIEHIVADVESIGSKGNIETVGS